ncbi:MAG: hypothetical protein ACRDSJ_13755 [Rubrobacteraceae bacterium]
MSDTPHIELKSLAKRTALTLAAASALTLCATAALAQEEVPTYEVIDVFEATSVNEIRVATEETREPGMRVIADDLRDSNEFDNVPEDGTLLVEYYDSEDTSENTGFALVFDSEEAVLDTGDTERFGEVYDEEDAERIIEEEDGIRVVSNEEFAEENASIWDRIKDFIRLT